MPAWYGATSPEAAVAESIFHDLPVHGGVVTVNQFRDRIVSTVTFTRPLTLAQLDSDGLRRLGLRPTDLTDTAADTYDQTAQWAAALHDQHPPLDGLAWVSRQRNTDRAVVLFGDRVHESQLITGAVERDFANIYDWEWLRTFGDRCAISVDPPS